MNLNGTDKDSRGELRIALHELSIVVDEQISRRKRGPQPHALTPTPPAFPPAEGGTSRMPLDPPGGPSRDVSTATGFLQLITKMWERASSLFSRSQK